MKFIAIAALAASLMGCNLVMPSAKSAYLSQSDAFLVLCSPTTITAALQQNEDQVMMVSTCSKAK